MWSAEILGETRMKSLFSFADAANAAAGFEA